MRVFNCCKHLQNNLQKTFTYVCTCVTRPVPGARTRGVAISKNCHPKNNRRLLPAASTPTSKRGSPSLDGVNSKATANGIPFSGTFTALRQPAYLRNHHRRRKQESHLLPISAPFSCLPSPLPSPVPATFYPRFSVPFHKRTGSLFPPFFCLAKPCPERTRAMYHGKNSPVLFATTCCSKTFKSSGVIDPSSP